MHGDGLDTSAWAEEGRFLAVKMVVESVKALVMVTWASWKVLASCFTSPTMSLRVAVVACV